MSITGIALKMVALFQWDDELLDEWTGKSGSTLGNAMFFGAWADAVRIAGLLPGVLSARIGWLMPVVSERDVLRSELRWGLLTFAAVGMIFIAILTAALIRDRNVGTRVEF